MKKENSITQTLEEINNLNPKFKQLLALNQKQTADAIGVSSSTLETWRKEGIGPEYKKQNNGKRARVLYPKTAIAEWLADTVKTA
ncbi:helix-turn-helix domain-containing protein [Sulfurimonas sp.]|uniref:helix-turn-helix transcriptional regulator n=1 Tax=Sulfurimonas sp. TaxID=2022749 RepID=UPI00262AD6A3|nr:helix-turn-helix domain-containing protein [Sulfurimonas sp.]MDD3856000.1 helix-turn-helix domain-containing protein [Sulfurimonas sp.]